LTDKHKHDRFRPTRKELALAATDRMAREILRDESAARHELNERLKARRLEREANGPVTEP